VGNRLEFRILGPLEVWRGAASVRVGGPRQRALLALLLCNANRVVSRQQLVDELMSDQPADAAERMLHVQISRLRKAIDGDGDEPRLLARPPGYLLRVGEGELDLREFEQRLADGRRAREQGDTREAAAKLRDAESLWRGRPLADLEFEPFARLEVGRLEELQLLAVEERIEAELELGRHAALVPELEALVAEHPLRERLRGLLMVALYRAGRQAEALEAYRAGRRELLDELGLEPAPELQELERAILTHDPALRREQAIVTDDPAPRLERAIPAHDQALEPAARQRPARKRPFRRELAVAFAAGLVVVAAIVVVLVSGPSSSVRLAANEIGAIDTATGQVALAQPVGSPPTGMAVGRGGAVWVASATGTLSRIDPKTHAITQIPVGSDPVAVAVAPDGSVWIANSGDGTVSRVSPESDTVVGTVRVGAGPSALVATGGAIWVANTLSSSVSKIDPTNDTVTATVPVGSEPAGIAAGAGSVWVADQGDATVYRLDQQTGEQVVGPITVGNGPIGVAFGEGAAWVANSTDGTLSRIDAQSDSVTTIPVGQGPCDVAAGAGRVWVSDEYGNAVAQVDPATLHLVHTTPTNGAPLGLALASDRLWVATDGNGAVAHRGGILEALASGLNGAMDGDPPTIDPGSAYVTDLWRVLVMTSDGLVGYRRAGGVAGNELVPDLAVALPAPTDHGLTYTFRIRSGVRYSNGVLLRASDFRRGLERAFVVGGGPVVDLALIVGAQRCLTPPPPAPPPARCDLSHGIIADDAANTVTVHLTKPDPDLLAQLTLPAAYPVPPGTGVKLPTRTVPGTGPYEISSYSPDLKGRPGTHGVLVLKRNPYFRQWSAAAQPTGFPNQIAVRTNYSEAQQVTAVEHGQADMTWEPPTPSDVTALSQSFPSQLHQNPLRAIDYVWLNVRSAPFENLLARQAFNYAVDRAALTRFAGGPNVNAAGSGRPTCQLLPPDFPGYAPYCPYTADPTPSGRWLAPDLLKAQALVRESGTGGAPVTLLLPSFYPRRVGEVLVANLRAIGYHSRLADLPFYQALASPPSFYSRFQAGVGGGWWADYVAPAQIIPYFVECSVHPMIPLLNPNGAPNFEHFCDPSLDAKTAKALSDESAAPGVASQEWTAIDREIVDLAIDVPIDNALGVDFVAHRVSDYQYNPQWGVLVDQLWVR
jgi:YVTN family beta-propeller protein